MTQQEIMEILAYQLSKVAEGDPLTDDYKIVVCSERVFIDDFQPAMDEYIVRMRESDGDIENPAEAPYKKTIFFVIKVGDGSCNFAIIQNNFSIQALSEENTFAAAKRILEAFVDKYNFTYNEQGMIEAFHRPVVSSSSEQVYAGFRALISLSGDLKMPTRGVVFINKIEVSEDGTNYFNLPFIHVAFSHTCTPDSASFSGSYGGASMALNRNSVQTVVISTYLWDTREGSLLDVFSSDVIEAMNSMNRKFKIRLSTNISQGDEAYSTIIDDWFILSNASYSQNLGEVSPWSLTFARAREKEDGEQ